MPYKHVRRLRSKVRVEKGNSSVNLNLQPQPHSPDMPTVARMRQRLAELGTDDVTINQAVWVFGVSTSMPIRLRIERGELAAAKVMGEWRIDVQSIHRYLDKVNKQFNKG